VIESQSGKAVLGEYTAGWIKRGATGVIGTNKPDAAETVEAMVEDVDEGELLDPEHPQVMAAREMIASRQPHFFSYDDWQKLDEIEVARGKDQGRPRVKFVSVEEMLAALGKA
jgi:ferredoxin--NADP+ reductase